MRHEAILRVVFFASEGGRESVRAWLRELGRGDGQTIDADLETAQFGWPLGMPLVRKLDGDLWDVRSRLREAPTRTAEGTPALNEQHIGSSLDEFLEQEGLLEVASAMAAKRVIAHQIRRAMRDCRIGPSELARRMGASRSTVERLLDMDNPSVTLLTLARAAAAVGKRLDVTLSDAP